MQSDAYQEFLFANSRRNYPFVEDASMWDDGSDYEIPNSAILSLRGFSRQEPESPPVPVQLAGLVGPSASDLPGAFQVDPTGWVMVFRLGTLNQSTGSPQYLRVVVDLNTSSDPSLLDTLVGFVPSSFGQEQPAGDMANVGLTRNPASGTSDNYDYLAAMIHVSVGEDILDLMPEDDTSRLYFSTAFVEPALFLNIWNSEVERVVIEDQCWEEGDASSNLVFRGGYNVDISRIDNSIQISPERGAGLGVQQALEYEEWLCGGSAVLDENPDITEQELRELLQDPCRGSVSNINGIGPDENFDFSITGDNGVTIQNFPNEHLIIINVSIPLPSAVCPGGE